MCTYLTETVPAASCLVAAVASALIGERYHHREPEETETATETAPARAA